MKEPPWKSLFGVKSGHWILKILPVSALLKRNVLFMRDLRLNIFRHPNGARQAGHATAGFAQVFMCQRYVTRGRLRHQRCLASQAISAKARAMGATGLQPFYDL